MEQMPSNTPMMESRPGPAGWLPVWIKALTKPSEQTYVEISESPEATQKTAFIWAFIAGTVSAIFQVLGVGIGSLISGIPLGFPATEQFAPSSGDTGSAVTILLILLCASPLFGLLSVLGFALGTAIIQWIAKLFGGVGTFEKLAYTIAAISVPFTLISSVFSLFSGIPFIGACTGLLLIGLSFYVLYLQIVVVKAINRFGWGEAVGSVLIPGFVVLFVCGCVVIGSLTALGPVIGNVFSEINQNLAP